MLGLQISLVKFFFHAHRKLRLLGRQLLALSLQGIRPFFLKRLYKNAPSILVTCKDQLSLHYAATAIQLLYASGRPLAWYTPRRLRYQARSLAAKHKWRLGFPGLCSTLLSPWRVALFPSHSIAAYLAPQTTAVFIGHGPALGRRLYDNSCYLSGWKSLKNSKQSAYDIGFTCGHNQEPTTGRSTIACRDVVMSLPEFPCSDSVPPRSWPAKSKTLLLASSWSQRALFIHYPEIISRLADRWQVLFTLHPRILEGSKNSFLLRKCERLGGRFVGQSPESILKAMTEADILLSDVSSICLYFLAFNKPLALLASDQIPRAELARRFYQACRKVRLEDDLHEQLCQLLKQTTPPLLQDFQQPFTTHLGSLPQFEQTVMELYENPLSH